MERIEEAVREIINDIKKDRSFDSNQIFAKLEDDNDYKPLYDELLKEKKGNESIAHANIAKHILTKLEKEGIIERLKRTNKPIIHYSMNIKDKGSENALWFKVR